MSEQNQQTGLIKLSTLEDAIMQQSSGSKDLAEYCQFQIGDYCIDGGSSYNPSFQIVGFKLHETDGGHKYVHVQYKRFDIDYENEDVILSDKIETSSLGDFKAEKQGKYKFYHTKHDLVEYIKLAKQAIAGTLQYEEKEEISNSTGLIHASSKATLEGLQLTFENKRQHLQEIRNLVQIKLLQEEQKLRSIKSNLETQMAVFMRQIEVIMKTIQSIELYLGINEDLFQLQAGEPAPADTKISFRQLILFMDEEVASTDDQGLDYKDINKFDRWLIKNDQYKKLVPEEKCVVVFKPRRYEKHYSNNAIENSLLNQYNKTTYLLIRNGENLYRIYSDNLFIYGKLFPKSDELMKILEQKDLAKEYEKDRYQSEADKFIEKYSRQSLMLQGLIDRSNVFSPLPPVEGLSIFKLEQFSEHFQFIYDAEATLPSGRMSFQAWQQSINNKIDYGSRVILTWAPQASKESGGQYRYMRYYDSHFRFPNPPSDGLYKVQPYKEEKDEWINQANPDHVASTRQKLLDKKIKFTEREYNGYVIFKYDIIGLSVLYADDRWYWSYDGDEKKRNRKRYKIYKDDKFILNYDQIDLDDIEFYLTNRVDRPNYLSMMPVLRELKKQRLTELEGEQLFVNLVVNTFKASEEKVWRAVEWWKTKNQWKRPIKQDDSKALRMIEKWLKRNK